MHEPRQHRRDAPRPDASRVTLPTHQSVFRLELPSKKGSSFTGSPVSFQNSFRPRLAATARRWWPPISVWSSVVFAMISPTLSTMFLMCRLPIQRTGLVDAPFWRHHEGRDRQLDAAELLKSMAYHACLPQAGARL